MSDERAGVVAFIGLGIMGKPMAVNLLRAGYDVVGYSRSPHSVDELEEMGGRRALTIAGAVRDADVIVTMLPDSPQVKEVVLGAGGVVNYAKNGALLIDMSSIAPDVSREVHELATARGLDVLDAPVSGGEQGAISGTLSIMVGGAASVFERALPVLRTLGATIVHVGPAGSGQTVKTANQLIVAGNIQVLSEALVFLRTLNVDMDAAISVLEAGLAGSTVLSRKAKSMVAGNFAPGFRIELHDKDLGIYSRAAREAGVAAPVGAVLAQLMASARLQGDGGLDHSALFRMVERLSGVAEQ